MGDVCVFIFATMVEKEVECCPKFKVYRKNKSSTSGGIITWIWSDIPQKRINDLEFDCNN